MAAFPSTSEMLCGPDLGGGYLHQLSREDGPPSSFTHHAQEGGQDAAGPPVGALDRLGFVHPAAACMFGGPRCWHRRYRLPFSANAKVRFAYQRHRLVLDVMLRQAHDLAPVPIPEALEELVRRIAGPLASEGIVWYVGGSTAVWLAGGGGSPHDIDVGVGAAGVERLGEILADYLIEPVAPTDGAGGRPVIGGRAFVGTPKSGARVEWAVPLGAAEGSDLDEFGPDPSRVRTVAAIAPGGAAIRVSRPEYALVRAEARGRPSSVEAALAAIGSVGPDLELLDRLLAPSSVPPDRRAFLRTRASAAAEGSARPVV
jgi:hypothetical protein